MASASALRASGRIAAALLAELSVSGGETANADARAVLADAGGSEAGLSSEGAWISSSVLSGMFRAAGVDRAMSRRIGGRLVSVADLGLALRAGDVASAEKAFRRCDWLLPRESQAGLYEAGEISDQRGRIRFHPTRPGQSPTDMIDCGVREGMLSALPTLFGLPPARVRERQCASRGAPLCEFDVRWRTRSATGLWLGAAGGAALALALVPWLLPALGVGVTVLAAAAFSGVAAGAGRGQDLARELEALRTLRRNAPTWLDAVERTLDEKMDALAKLDARLERLDESQGSESAAEVEPVRAAPAPLVRSAIEDFRRSAPPGLELRLDLDEDAPAIRCRPPQIERMLTELLRHAAGCGGAVVRVSLRSTLQGVELSVSDEGDGIDDEEVEELFDPFSPAADSASATGLPASYRIAVDHGGELRVESEPGGGTRFVVVLPPDLLGAASTAH